MRSLERFLQMDESRLLRWSTAMWQGTEGELALTKSDPNKSPVDISLRGAVGGHLDLSRVRSNRTLAHSI